MNSTSPRKGWASNDPQDRAVVNKALLLHFFPPKPLPIVPSILRPHKGCDPLRPSDISPALRKCTSFSASGLDTIPYLVEKRVHLTLAKQLLLWTDRHCVQIEEISPDHPVCPAGPQRAPAEWLHPCPLGTTQPASCPPPEPGLSISDSNLLKNTKVGNPLVSAFGNYSCH